MSAPNLRSRRTDAGFTLIEMIVSLGISTLLIGTVLLVQATARRGFDGSLNEHRMTQVMREGMNGVTIELRSAHDTTIQTQAWAGVEGTPLLSFKNAVGFDIVQGGTEWGGGDIVDGSIEYTVLDGNLVRRIRDANGDLVPTLEKVLVRDLDFSDPNDAPILFAWDANARTVGVTIRSAMNIDGRVIKRSVDTLIHIEKVYDF